MLSSNFSMFFLIVFIYVPLSLPHPLLKQWQNCMIYLFATTSGGCLGTYSNQYNMCSRIFSSIGVTFNCARLVLLGIQSLRVLPHIHLNIMHLSHSHFVNYAYMVLLGIRSLRVLPHIHLNIHISVIPILLSSHIKENKFCKLIW